MGVPSLYGILGRTSSGLFTEFSAANSASFLRRKKKVSLTAEQLQAVRAERWRQKSNPVLTLEDAAAWLNTTGLCLFLPRRNQFLAPAPSFVEACSGGPSETPAPGAIETASSLMIRLIENGAVLPLNLFGTLSEQPDFLATRDAFPFIFSLRGGRSWKVVPAKASPLVAEIWKLLEKDASLETAEIQAALGRELTEAAVLRGLMELWSALRVIPVYAANEPTRWELTQTRFSDALNAANKIAQTTALSALVSLYLESVLAATPDEVETFLSPLTSRSKVREVVNGLAATRQVSIIPVGTQTMFHVAGSLPEFAEPEPATAPLEAGPRPRFERPPFGQKPRETRGPERRPSSGRDRTGDRPRTGPSRERFAAGGARPGGAGRGSEHPIRRGTDFQGNYPPRRKQFGAKTGGPSRPGGGSSAGGDRPPYRKPTFSKPEEGERPRSYPRKAEGAGGERRPFTKRLFEKRPFSKSFGERGAAGDRPPRRESSPRTSERTSSGELRPGTGRPSFRAGGGKFPPKKFGTGDKFPPKKFGPKKFNPKPFSNDRPRPASGDRPFRPRREEASDRPRSPRPYDRAARSDRPARPPSGGRPYGAGKPWEAKKRDGEKRPFFRDKPAKTGRDDRSGSRGQSGAPAKRTGGWKPKPSGFSKSSKPASGKPKFGGARFGGARTGGKKYGAKPGFKSGPKPGGARPPFRKRKDEGKKSSE
jgi:23S rRNA pseudouridine2605 synthase